MISAIFAACALGVLVYVNFLRPLIRRRRLKKPCEMFFVITTSGRRILGYVQQDNDNEHLVNELVLPVNSTLVIEILLTPKMHFHSTELVIGMDGGASVEARPVINKYLNRFVAWGKGQEETPDTNPQHYRDHHGHYHTRSSMSYSVGTDRATGFEITTRQPGDFSVLAMFIGDEVEGTARLLLRIRASPCVEVKCVKRDHKNCYLTFDPAAAPKVASAP